VGSGAEIAVQPVTKFFSGDESGRAHEEREDSVKLLLNNYLQTNDFMI